MEMGLTPGVELQVIGAAPLGDPLELEVRGYRLERSQERSETSRSANIGWLTAMSVAASPKTLTVALIGNPNTGKSTLFTALAGVRQRVGNYPGVTVEKKIGTTEFDGQRVHDCRSARHIQPRAALAGRNGGGRRAARPAERCAGDRRRALDRRRQQSGAQSLPA